MLLIEIGAAVSIADAPAEIVSTVLILVGSAAAVVALLRLGRSFSMMAEARRLVTSRSYRYMRHPLYLAEELAIIGLFLQFALLWTMLLLGVRIAFQLRCMRNEETSSRRLPRIRRLSTQDRAAGPWHLLKPARPAPPQVFRHACM